MKKRRALKAGINVCATRLNRKGFRYIVGEDCQGNETITIFQPEILIDQKDADGVATVHHPDKVQEVKRLENPDNF